MGDIDAVLSYATLGLLALFLIVLIGNMLFGMMRGWKRTSKRTVVLLGFFIFALLITPLITMGLVNSALGKTAYKAIMKLVDGDSSAENPSDISIAFDTMKDIQAFALGLPAVVINIAVFFVLLVLFRYMVSPIFSKLLLSGIAPKKDAEGNKMPKGNIWAGLGMGAVQGLVIFAFFCLPLLGLMSTINKIDRYEPRVGGLTVDFFNSNSTEGVAGSEDGNEDSGMESTFAALGDFNKTIRDINTGIQGSAVGVITRFTGLQAFGDFGFTYFCNVKAGKTNVNVKNDIEVGFELTRDFVVIYDLIEDAVEAGDAKYLIPLFSRDADVKYIKNVVDKTFNLGLTRLALNSEFGEFAREKDVLSDIDTLNSVTDDPALYRESIYDGMGNLNSKFVREDLISLIELLRLVFAEHKLNATTDVSLYRDIDNMMRVVDAEEISAVKGLTVDSITFYNKQDALAHVFGNLDRTLSLKNDEFKYIISGKGKNAVTGTRNLAQQILYVFGNMNIFKKLLLDETNMELHSMPLAKILGMDPTETEINNQQFDKIMDGLADIVIRVVRVGPTVYKLANESEIVGFADVLSENDGAAIIALGEILEILTNRGDANGFISDGETSVMGIGNMLRKFIADTVTEQFKDGSDSESVISFDRVLGPLVEKLSPSGPDIEWATELKNIVDVVVELGDVLSGNIDPDELMNKLLSDDLLDKVAGSGILSDIIVGVVDGVVNDMLDGTGVHFNFDGVSDSKEVVAALGELAKTMSNITEWMENMNDADLDSFAVIVDLLGAGTEDESAIALLANSGVRIDINEAENGFLTQGALDSYLNTLDDITDSNLINAVKKLFGRP